MEFNWEIDNMNFSRILSRLLTPGLTILVQYEKMKRKTGIIGIQEIVYSVSTS
jgi:hypothetical protein